MINDKYLRKKVVQELEFYGGYIKLEANLQKKIASLKADLTDGYGSCFEAGTSGHIKTDDRVVALMDRIEQEERMLKKNRLRKDFIEEALKHISEDEYKLIKELYIWGKSGCRYAIDHNYDRSSIYRKKVRILDKLALLLFPEEFFVLDNAELDKEISKRL